MSRMTVVYDFARFVLLAVSKEAKTRLPYIFLAFSVNKTIIRFVFCDTQSNQGLGKGYQAKPEASTLIILHLTRASSNNCL